MRDERRQSFLSRWSRRKLDAAKEVAAKEVAAPKSAPAPAQAAPATTQSAVTPPSVETLQGLASDYKDFLRPEIEERLRRAALKKLFRDPHFNVMDGLDVYIDDYSKPDPIPDAMMRTLAHAKGLLFDDKKDEVKVESPAAPAPSELRAPADAKVEAAPGVPVEKKEKA
jgi:Protein of unknown function (DUF3306)